MRAFFLIAVIVGLAVWFYESHRSVIPETIQGPSDPTSDPIPITVTKLLSLLYESTLNQESDARSILALSADVNSAAEFLKGRSVASTSKESEVLASAGRMFGYMEQAVSITSKARIRFQANKSGQVSSLNSESNRVKYIQFVMANIEKQCHMDLIPIHTAAALEWARLQQLEQFCTVPVVPANAQPEARTLIATQQFHVQHSLAEQQREAAAKTQAARAATKSNETRPPVSSMTRIGGG